MLLRCAQAADRCAVFLARGDRFQWARTGPFVTHDVFPGAQIKTVKIKQASFSVKTDLPRANVLDSCAVVVPHTSPATQLTSCVSLQSPLNPFSRKS